MMLTVLCRSASGSDTRIRRFVGWWRSVDAMWKQMTVMGKTVIAYWRTD